LYTKIFVSYLVLTTVAGCQKSKSQTNENSLSMAPLGDSVRPPIGHFEVDNPESQKKLLSLNDNEKALLIMAADNSLAYDSNNLQRVRIPFATVPKINYAGEPQVETQHKGCFWQDGNTKKNIASILWNNGNEYKIPIHPETRRIHPTIKEEINKVKSDFPLSKGHYDFAAFKSMSRSLWIFNPASNNIFNQLPILTTIKLATDTVAGKSEPSKLWGIENEVRWLNALVDHTSIVQLADHFGIQFLLDSYGVIFYNNYGVILRDYTPLITKDGYIFMPMALFLEPVIMNDAAYWILHKKSIQNSIYNKNDSNSILKLSMPKETLAHKVLPMLLQEWGKLLAIYYLNGITSIDLHGQNVLVGIPLKSSQKPMLVIRDVSDSSPYRYDDMAWDPPRFPQRSLGPIVDPKWCQLSTQCTPDFIKSHQNKGYNEVLSFLKKHVTVKKLSYEIDNDWPASASGSSSSAEIYRSLEAQTGKTGAIVRSVQKWRPNRAPVACAGTAKRSPLGNCRVPFAQ
jgi:hypothetical protein